MNRGGVSQKLVVAVMAATGLGAETPQEAVEKILMKIREQLFLRGVKGLRAIGRFFGRLRHAAVSLPPSTR